MWNENDDKFFSCDYRDCNNICPIHHFSSHINLLTVAVLNLCLHTFIAQQKWTFPINYDFNKIFQYSLWRDAVLAASVCGLVLWGQKSALWVVSRLISSPLQQRRKVLALHKNSNRFPSLWGKRIWRRGILTLLPCNDSGSHESRVLVNIYFFIYADADLGELI